MPLYTWNNADILWNNNPFTWDEVELVRKLAGERAGYADWDVLNQSDQKRLIKLILSWWVILPLNMQEQVNDLKGI